LASRTFSILGNRSRPLLVGGLEVLLDQIDLLLTELGGIGSDSHAAGTVAADPVSVGGGVGLGRLGFLLGEGEARG
jgi:hypothetical protein